MTSFDFTRRSAIYGLAAFTALSATATSLAQQGGRKVALVIGNSRYGRASPLPNAARDAALISRALQSIGFDVAERNNVTAEQCNISVREFGRVSKGADIALIYYAGHGMESAYRNWMLCTDFSSAVSAPAGAVQMDRFFEACAGARLQVAIFDACRTMPKPESAGNAVRQGLVGLEVEDVLTLYAAASGYPAYDGEGTNSIFATALARNIVRPDVEVRLMAGQVRSDVLLETEGLQRPFVGNNMSGEAYFLHSVNGGSSELRKCPPSGSPSLLIEGCRPNISRLRSCRYKTRKPGWEGEFLRTGSTWTEYSDSIAGTGRRTWQPGEQTGGVQIALASPPGHIKIDIDNLSIFYREDANTGLRYWTDLYEITDAVFDD